MKCFECEIYYSAYLEDDLEGALRKEFEAHLAGCEHCRRELDELREAMTALHELPVVPPRPGFVDSVTQAAIRSEGLVGRILQLRWSAVAASAALLLLGVGMGMGLRPKPSAAPLRLADALADQGYRYDEGEWISPEANLRRDRQVYLRGTWRSRSEATDLLMRERGLTAYENRWVTPKEKKALEAGKVRFDKEWKTPEEVLAAEMSRRDLVPEGEGWVSRKEKTLLAKGYVRSGSKWESSSTFLQKQMQREGLERQKDGTWASLEDRAREEEGLIRLGTRWMDAEDALALLLAREGYEETGGAWKRMEVEEEEPDPAPKGGTPIAEEPRRLWEAIEPSPLALFTRSFSVSDRKLWGQVVKKVKSRRESVDRDRLPKVIEGPLGMKVWSQRVGAPGIALGTPAVRDGRVYVGSGMTTQRAWALDAETGRIGWRVRLDDKGVSSPFVLDDTVYFSTESCSLLALETTTGKSRWGWWLAPALKSMPVASGPYVFQSLKSEHHALLSAYERRRGKLGWTAPLPSEVLAAPRIKCDRLYLTTMAHGTVHCFDLNTGEELWGKAIHALTPPVWSAGRLVVRRAVRVGDRDGEFIHGQFASYAETLSTLRPEDGSFIGETVGALKRMRGIPLAGLLRQPLLEPDAPRPVGKLKPIGILPGPPAIQRTTAFLVRGDRLLAVDLHRGKELWSRPLEGGEEKQIHSDPAVAGPFVFVGSLAGRLWCLYAKSGKPVWSVELKSPIGNAAWEELTLARVQPVVADGRVYVTTLKGELICVDTGNRALQGPRYWLDASGQ
ncbi:MAG: outer membrane protein assembly factor BamB family protein [Planctomycetota bacterium]|jgi:outer membrane protein assembly factor BamB